MENMQQQKKNAVLRIVMGTLHGKIIKIAMKILLKDKRI